MYPIKNQLEDYIKTQSLFTVSDDSSINNDINKLIKQAAIITFSEWKKGEIRGGTIPNVVEDKMKKDTCDTLKEILLEYNVEESSIENDFTKSFLELKK